MLRHLVLALAAAAFVAVTLNPGDALAYHYRHHAVRDGYGWGPDPRASRAGYYGGHYGSDCYHAANRHWICPDRY